MIFSFNLKCRNDLESLSGSRRKRTSATKTCLTDVHRFNWFNAQSGRGSSPASTFYIPIKLGYSKSGISIRRKLQTIDKCF